MDGKAESARAGVNPAVTHSDAVPGGQAIEPRSDQSRTQPSGGPGAVIPPDPAEETVRPTPPQLVLDLAHVAGHGAQDFLVGPPNRSAFDVVRRWPDWPGPSLLLSGPTGSGKSHLAAIWRQQAGANGIAATDLTVADLGVLAAGRAIAIEDIDRLAGVVDGERRADAERALFHLLNLARETGLAVLLTAGRAPGDIVLQLPDLRSRIRALPFVAIEAADEALLSALLVKLFDDRQVMVEPHLVTYLVRHIDRTMAAAHRIVALLDARALAEKRAITRALAADILTSLGRSIADA